MSTIPVDIALEADGDLLIADEDFALVEGAASLAQRIEISLSTMLGEWFLDTTAGVDWLGTILVKNPDTSAIDAILRARIAEVPGVSRILSLVLEVGQIDRVLRVSFRVLADDDSVAEATMTITDDGEFAVLIGE